MESSLRYGGDSKSLRIHAKEKYPIAIATDSNTLLQLHGELDTRLGAPTYLSAMIRHFYPDVSASIGAGVQYTRRDELRYSVRGKKTFPVTDNGSVNFNINGQFIIDKEFKKRESQGAAELNWIIFNFKKDQDLRFKVGYEVVDKILYFQIKENNWTFNADGKGKWNVRYDL